MSDGKVVILASKEGETLDALSGRTSQSVLLLQKDVSSLREDLIIESENNHYSKIPPSAPPITKRKIHLEDRIEPWTILDDKEVISKVPHTNRCFDDSNSQLDSVNTKYNFYIRPIEKLKEDSVPPHPWNPKFECDALKSEDGFYPLDEIEVLSIQRSLTEVNVKEEQYCCSEDESFGCESELLDPLQNPSDLLISSSPPLEPPTRSGVLVYLEPENDSSIRNQRNETFHTRKRSFGFSSMTVQPKVPCRFCNVSYKATFLSEHIRKKHLSTTKGYQKIKCNNCDKAFKSAENLRNHIIRSHLTCSICAKNCKTFKDLDRHHNESHCCSLCKKLFISKDKVEKHKEDVHNICHICAQEHDSVSLLQSHIQNHHPKCFICGLTCRNRENLLRHEKEHIQCFDCNVLFEGIHEKKKHFSLHHSCSYCNKIFEKIAQLNVHKVAHRTCPICRMQFETVTEQIKHQNTNHFRCNICSIIFRRLEDFSHHQRLAHQLFTSKKPEKNKKKVFLQLKDN